MNWLIQLIGILLIILVSVDIFLTVLCPQTGRSILSMPLSRMIWFVFCRIAKWTKKDCVLSFCGSTILIFIAVVWMSIYVIGFALFFWPTLGTGIQAGQGETPTDFATAIYYSGFNFTTLGVGDLVPKKPLTRIVTIFEASLGFASFTISLTYLLSLLQALTQRNIFATSLHHRTGKRANVVELLLGWGIGGEFDYVKQEMTNMSRNLLYVLESHRSYPILHYFRFKEAYYSVSRMGLMTMDTVTLIKSALHPEKYKSLINSTAVTELQSGGFYMLTTLGESFLPKKYARKLYYAESQWREWYYYVVGRLEAEGIKVPDDIEKGADVYVSLRRDWNTSVVSLGLHMKFKWRDIAPAESEVTTSVKS